jgi:hypothetical protein
MWSGNTNARNTDGSSEAIRALCLAALLLIAASRCLAEVREGGARPTNGGEEDTTEYAIKGAMVYNFTKFVSWPAEAFPEANSPLVFCIVGSDPFGAWFDNFLKDKQYFGRPLRLRRLAVGEAEGCHVVFVSRSEQRRLAEVLAIVTRPGVFTVSDIDRFAVRGGMIGLFTRDDKVQFEINRDVAQKMRLIISSKLLHMANEVGVGEFR